MNIPIIIYKDEDWVYIAESPLLEWFHTFWKTKEELFKNIDEVIELYKDLIKTGQVKVDKTFLMNYFIDLQSNNVKV